MKKNLLQLSLLASALLVGGSAEAQQMRAKPGLAIGSTKTAPLVNTESKSTKAFSPADLIRAGNLPKTLADLTGATRLPIASTYPLQTNGHALHNVQVDPDHPNMIHAVVMGTTDLTPADTAASASRRCFYTFSNDGGQTWKTPVLFGTTRTGFPNMILFKRADGNYVPLIAAHHVVTNSTDLVSALYIEQGAPGTGNFKVADANRNASNGNPEDLIWPSIALSPNHDKVYMISDFSGGQTNFEFGTFSMTADGLSATFDGWISEPGSGNENLPTAGWTSGGDHQVRVSESGKVGVMWFCTDPADPSLYFLESTNGGTSWSEVTPLIAPGEPDANVQDAQLTATSGFDFWYSGEKMNLMWMSMFQDLNNNTYFPTSSTIFFSKPGFDGPTDLISKFFTNAQYAGDFLVSYPIGSVVDPQFQTVLNYPTVARTSDTNVFAVFYQGYQEGDSAFVGDLGNDNSYYFYGSIWYQATTDGGLTWTEARPFRTNEGVTGQKNDFRFPSVSEWNPITAGRANYSVVFEQDTAAGYLRSNGLPGFGPQDFYYQSTASLGVKGQTTAKSSLSLTQNYPNPFNSVSTISFDLKENSNVVLEISDAMGRPVKTLVNQHLSAGPHELDFNSTGLPAGTYNYTLRANGESVTRSMTILK